MPPVKGSISALFGSLTEGCFSVAEGERDCSRSHAYTLPLSTGSDLYTGELYVGVFRRTLSSGPVMER